MGMTASVLLATVFAGLQVDVSTLDGQRHSGTLAALTSKEVTLAGDNGERAFPLSNLLEVTFPAQKPDVDTTSKTATVYLADGSRMSCSAISTTVKSVKCTGPYVGQFEVAPTMVSSLRLAPADDRVEADWQKLQQRTLKRDLLVIRKGDVLDYQDGIIGDIDDKLVKFSLDGDEIPIKREKVFGIIYARRPPGTGKPLCRLDLGKSDELLVESVTCDGKKAAAILMAGAKIDLNAEALRSIDYSLGKVRYLSQMEPRDVKYTPFFDITWEYRRDRNLDGGPIRIGKQDYARGLSIHSKTSLRYRLGGEFRRFQAVMGIDASVASNGMGDVHVVISGDGKTLLEADVQGRHAPKPLDLDVTGVRDLEILVDFGGDLDIADHLDLAEARVIK